MELLRTNGVLMRPTRVFSIFTVSVSLLLAVSVPAHAESPLENVEGEVSSSVDDVAAYNEGILLNTTPAALMADDSTFLVTDAFEVSDGNAVVRSGYWSPSSTWQITSPGLGTVGSNAYVVQKNL